MLCSQTGAFKQRWCAEKKVDPAAVTVYYNVNGRMQEREDDMPLSARKFFPLTLLVSLLMDPLPHPAPLSPPPHPTPPHI